MGRKRRRFAERRKAMGLSQERLAEAVGVDASTVARWERGETEPQAIHRPRLAEALHVSAEEVGDLLAEADEAPSVELALPDRQAGEASRRQVLAQTLGVAAGASLYHLWSSLDRPAKAADSSLLAAYRDVAESLANMYRAVDPRAVLSVAATYADQLLDLYGQQTDGRARTDLATLLVGAHCLVGLWACHAHQPSRARPYLATACDVAAELDDRSLYARALGSLSYLHSSAPRGGTGGNPRRALELLTEALALASKVDGFTRGWLATWRADQYATLGDLPAARADIELADTALGVGDDGPEHGFFARRHYGYGIRGHLESVRGLVYALAGELDESEQLFTKVQADAANGRRRVATAAHQALAFTRASQPEAACQALDRSITMAVADPYPMGLERVRGVRAEFSQAWASLPCVRDLNQRLASLAPADV